MKTIKRKYFILMLLCCPFLATAQVKKLNKTFKADPTVSVNIDARHTNVIVENWDRNEVEIEAFLEGEQATGEKAKQLLENWKLEASGTPAKINITSGGGMVIIRTGDIVAMPSVPSHPSVPNVPEIVGPVMEMVGPLLESIAQNPLPPEFHEKLGNLHFDHEAYRKEGEAYMKQWEKKIEENFGEDFGKSMEKWAANFEKDSLRWNKDMELKMEKWGEQFGKEMEAWGENFGKEMEVWAKQFEKDMEAQNGSTSVKKIIMLDDANKVKRTIRIKMPAQGTINMNVRHGEVYLNGKSNDLRANLSHSRLSAGTIAGKQTNVKVSYTPIKVRQWEYGVLETAFVKNCDIETARSIKLTSNSSDVRVGEILETGIISGTFAQLNIDKLGRDLRNLDVTLENSDLRLNLPETALVFNYNGSQSNISYPSSIKANPVQSYDSEIINGYHRSQNAGGTVTIKAKFSEVVVK